MLNRLALRLATVRALRGRTLAGNRVADSEVAAIDDVAAEAAAPVVIVYTDGGSFTATGRDLYTTKGDGRVESGYQRLVIEIAVTQRMRVQGGEDEAHVQPETDAAMEFTLDIIERQITTTLMSSIEPWAEMWRRFVMDIGPRESDRGTSMREGVRFAGRQITLSVSLPKEPPHGVSPGPLWTDFMSLAATDDSLAPVVPVLEAALAGTDLADWRVLAGAYGLTEAEARALGIGPADGGDDDLTFSATLPGQDESPSP
ncbi:hypothetical protein ACO2I3_12355 [Leptospira interrogans]